MLNSFNIPFAKSFLAKNEEEAIKFARKIGFPLVLKISSSKISHKTEMGGVEFVSSEDELRKKFTKMGKIAEKIDGIVIQEFLNGIELIVGIKKDAQFGHTLLFGAGGIYTEIYKDFSLRILPITKKDAKKMIKETKAYKILSGFRGKKYDIKAVETFLLKVSKIAKKKPEIFELDINPLFAVPKKCLAADVRVIIE